MSHGYHITGENDPIVATVDEAMEQFSLATSSSAFLANIFPARAYCCHAPPLASFHMCNASVLTLALNDSGARPFLVPWCDLQEDGRRMEEYT